MHAAKSAFSFTPSSNIISIGAPTLNADSFAISAFFFAFLGLKRPFLTHFFVVFPFFSEKFSLLMAAPISLKKSNRAKVGVIVQM